MLNIYYGRESANKEKFAFDQIKAGGDLEKVLIVVPDQFKLATERVAMEMLETDGIMGLEIMSLRRLGSQILKNCGGAAVSYIDKYGRHILLSDILDLNHDKMQVYGNQGSRPAFVDLVNNAISEFKRFGVSAQDLRTLLEGAGAGAADSSAEAAGKLPALLKAKLEDISLIYDEYEKRIDGRYVDTEDRVNLFLSHIKESDLVVGRQVWIWGFDWLAPKDLDIIRELMLTTNVNIIFTYDGSGADSHIFEITGGMIKKITDIAKENGIEYCKTPIDDAIAKPIAIATIERGLFTIPVGEAGADEKGAAAAGEVMLCEAASFNAEAESAAAYILWLVRNKNYRYREIALICNDLEGQGEITRQVFKEYGLPLFLDQRRNIMSSPAVGFLLALVDVVSRGYRSEDLFRMLKTGYGPLTAAETERLENYAIAYKISGARWKKSFDKAVETKEERELEELEELRRRAVEFAMEFDRAYKENRSATARTRAIYDFLKNSARLPEKLQGKISQLEKLGRNENAAELAQVWGEILKVLEQIIEVMGDENVSLDRYRGLITAGLSAVEIGVLPPSIDSLTMGTMQRTRLSGARAVVVLGACEGVLPKSGGGHGLLSETEKKKLAEDGAQVGKLQNLRSQEEGLAMYRLLSAPSERLYMSFSDTDSAGEVLRASEIFKDISRFFGLAPKLDILSQNQQAMAMGVSGSERDEVALKLVQAPDSAVRHLAEAVVDAQKYGQELPPIWQEVYAWCRENRAAQVAAMKAGIGYENVGGAEGGLAISVELAHQLYPQTDGNIRVSPSTIENYSKCPFKFFVQVGLSPEERRLYEMSSREIGDIYHECLEELMNRLSADGLEVNDPASLWQTVNREACDQLAGEIFDQKAAAYRKGLAGTGPEEKYRASRMKKVLQANAWALVSHVKRGQVKSIRLEQGFGFSEGAFSPIMVDTGSEKVRIVGKIDRVDVLEGGQIKIIDYKSGNNEIDTAQIKAGWRLQLMLYLKATGADASAGDAAGGVKPAGVFYYNIVEPRLPGSDSLNTVEKLENAVQTSIDKFNFAHRNEYAMSGLLVNDEGITRAIVGNAMSNRDKDWMQVVSGCTYGQYTDPATGEQVDASWHGKAVISPEEFSDLQAEFDGIITDLCRGVAGGKIDILPKKRGESTGSGSKNFGAKSACDYCPYHSICRFDTLFPGCEFDVVDC